ncbi:hypothetical protein ACCO45_006870 [Purpureocillium lilacinum]|uniref:Uncharacterized protein n=1 Tax=Purpureocillium lilacinum TaxID=33203 RepID=A0ACC4DRH6_PURLI
MASLQMHSSALGGPHGPVKITKSRGRTAVKPILKKLQSHHSDRESLDLDRGWDDQPSPRLSSLDFGSGPYDSDGGGYFGSSSQYGGNAGAGRTARDVSFSLASGDYGSGVGARGKFSHARSTSGTSHASIATTNSSGRNGGSFVHPFQQTPQMAAATPLTYTNPRASFDNSPTITEDDGDDVDPYPSYHSTASSASRPAVYQAAHLQQQGQRRPSLASQRTGSVSDGAQTLRVTASRSHSGSVQRLTSSSVNQSRSELQLSTANSVIDSPLSTTAPLTTSPTLLSSLDMGGFRLRSRSEVDTFTRQEHVREARRKFEAKERAKEEKYAREQSRKEAHKQERGQPRLRKESHGSQPGAINTAGLHRRRTPKPDVATEEPNEKGVHAGQEADGILDSQPRADSVQFKSPKRTKTAKHKTMGVWTSFMLWLRTRLLKLGR